MSQAYNDPYDPSRVVQDDRSVARRQGEQPKLIHKGVLCDDWHKAELQRVIGTDEPQGYSPLMPQGAYSLASTARNLLRAEQRKRAGL